MPAAFETVDEYVASFDSPVRERLQELRETMLAAAPGATERISYGIAALRVDGRDVIFFSGWKAHLGIYPVPPVPPEVEAELAPYRSGASTLKLPLKQPTPLDLVARLVGYAIAARA